MLPSFRLIAATFLCGFFVVFAGLKLAASLNDIHEGLPVLAAHAAPVSIGSAADREMRRGLSAVPVTYDLRFAVSTVAPTLIRIAPTVLDRPGPPLAILPAEDAVKEASLPATPEPEAAKEAARPEVAMAGIQPEAPVTQAPVTQAPPVIPDVSAEAAAPQAPAVAALDPRDKPDAAAGLPATEIPAPAAETPAPAVETAAPAAETPAIELQIAALPSIEETRTSPEPETPAAADPAPVDTPAADPAAIDAPTAEAAPKVAPALQQKAASPKAAKPAAKKRHAVRAARKVAKVAKIAAIAPLGPVATAAPHAKAKIARKRPVRTAHRAAPAHLFSNSSSAFSAPPGIPQQ